MGVGFDSDCSCLFYDHYGPHPNPATGRRFGGHSSLKSGQLFHGPSPGKLVRYPLIGFLALMSNWFHSIRTLRF